MLESVIEKDRLARSVVNASKANEDEVRGMKTPVLVAGLAIAAMAGFTFDSL
jgi:hypothetical protein